MCSKNNSYLNHAAWLLPATLAFASSNLIAEESEEVSGKEKAEETIYILGARQALPTEPGSAFRIDEEQLERYEYNDLQRILRKVPGVYFREEDGYGLRLNIGIRGASAERSQKIALMEDGVLIAPAPYAAPSAYYSPLMTRMVSVEVLKGPSAIQHGPNTVGGAVNLVSRSIPDDHEGMVDLGLGEDNFFKTHLHYGGSTEQFGWLIEGVHLQTDGFKELDSGGETGFIKNDFMTKLRWNTPQNAKWYQSLEFKLAYADEASDETYLGLTDEDFAQTPNRRYAATQLDNMEWDRQHYQLTHFVDFNNGLILSTKFYHNDFTRAWEKLNRFDTSRSLQTILASPNTGVNSIFYDVLTGNADSQSNDETLLVGTNDRAFYSQGIDVKLSGFADWWGVDHDWQIGLRFHADEIERDHTEDSYLMRSGLMFADGNATQTILQNRDYAESIAFFVQDALVFDRLTVTAGLRGEFIDTEATTLYPTSDTVKDSHNILLPGIGAFYQISESLGVLAGVNKGYVPNKPGQVDADPEESLNYEVGVRFGSGDTKAELIGFFSDYDNLIGVCTFSAGCVDDVDREFSGGEVDISGIELLASHDTKLGESLTLPVSLSYTFTQTEFQTSFESAFSQWGRVEEGDELPYVPDHQLTINTGLEHADWLIELSSTYVGEMQETAGDTSTPLDGLTTDDFWVFDLTGSYVFNRYWSLYASLENMTDSQEIVSRRPYGARPSKPRQAFMGIKYQF